MASGAIEVEEENVGLQALEEPSPEHISERVRLHGCGMDGKATDVKPMNMAAVKFSR